MTTNPDLPYAVVAAQRDEAVRALEDDIIELQWSIEEIEEEDDQGPTPTRAPNSPNATASSLRR